MSDIMKQDRASGSRRQYLKYTGTAISGAALAGCMGGGNGGGGDGSGGGGDGSGGGGDGSGDGGGATTTQQELETVRMVLSPFGFAGVVWDQMYNQTDRLESRMNEAGYTVKAKQSWEDAALFAAGGPDFADISPIEAATLGAERDLQLATNARMTSFFTAWLVKKGGPYDTPTTGSVEASVKKIANQGKFAIGSWGGGDVHAYQLIMPKRYGMRFAENKSDFKIVTADYFALPGLVVDGKVAATSTAPPFGATPMFTSDPPKLEALFYTSDLLEKMGYGTSMLNSWVCTQKFADENPEAVKAVVGAWTETVKDFYSRPYELATKKKYMKMLTAKNKKQAKYLIDWGFKNKYEYDTPMLYKDPTFTDKRIEQEKKFISGSAELGFIPSDWDDHLEFRTVKP